MWVLWGQLLLSGFDRTTPSGLSGMTHYLFSDGTSVSYADLINRGFDIGGTAAGDTLVGTNVNDVIKGWGERILMAAPEETIP